MAENNHYNFTIMIRVMNRTARKYQMTDGLSSLLSDFQQGFSNRFAHQLSKRVQKLIV
jgi:hypothetical protein